MAATPDLESGAARRVGSSPTLGTKQVVKNILVLKEGSPRLSWGIVCNMVTVR